MRSDINGCSTCQNGQEYHESFYSDVLRRDLVQYDYRTPVRQSIKDLLLPVYVVPVMVYLVLVSIFIGIWMPELYEDPKD